MRLFLHTRFINQSVLYTFILKTVHDTTFSPYFEILTLLRSESRRYLKNNAVADKKLTAEADGLSLESW